MLQEKPLTRKFRADHGDGLPADSKFSSIIGSRQDRLHEVARCDGRRITIHSDQDLPCGFAPSCCFVNEAALISANSEFYCRPPYKMLCQ